MSALIGVNVDARADAATLARLHELTGEEFPISGDDVARAKAGDDS